MCNLGTPKLILCVIYSSKDNQLSFKTRSCISGSLYISEIHEPHFILHYIGYIFLLIHISSHHSGSKDSIESMLNKHALSYYTDRYTNRISCTASNDRILIKHESGTVCKIVIPGNRADYWTATGKSDRHMYCYRQKTLSIPTWV
jgi:hypothetical protein